jgi:hypothetical protein
MTMLRRTLTLALVTLAIVLVAATGPVKVTGQLLAYQDGYVFFTTGDGFHVAANVVIRDKAGSAATKLVPGPRVWARATFSADGIVTELDLSDSPLPEEGSFADISRFAVALSTPLPNPDLAIVTPAPGQTPGNVGTHYSGKPVPVSFIVEVPPNTPFSSTVYISSDVAAWNPQAVPMNRIDALHFQILIRLNSGTDLHYLYTRGSFQAAEVAQNGLQRKPRELVVSDSDVRDKRDTVYGWLDLISGGSSGQQPNVVPTPYNPAPFPNLPPGLPAPGFPAPHHTPHP